jgi:hypothetical protein
MMESSLIEWGIDSVFTVTANNASTNDVGIDYMIRRMDEGQEFNYFGRRISSYAVCYSYFKP